MEQSFRLVSHVTCPYADRAAIAFFEKRQTFERVFVDLADKPDWLSGASPLGRIPLLAVSISGRGTIHVFESVPICEYIDQVTGEPGLFPPEPLANALAKGWIEVATEFQAKLTSYLAGRLRISEVRHILTIVAGFLDDRDYLSGDRFGIVDLAFAPALRRIALIREICKDDLFAESPALAAWSRRILDLGSVAQAEAPDFRATYIRNYLTPHMQRTGRA
jgi:glutathione S-transferase